MQLPVLRSKHTVLHVIRIPPTNYILYAPPHFMNFAIKKNMDMQEQMYQDVKAWLTSGMKKKDFVKSKQYDINKFDYWYRKYKAESQSKELGKSNKKYKSKTENIRSI